MPQRVHILVKRCCLSDKKSLKNLYYWILLDVITTGVIMSQEELQRSSAKNQPSNPTTLMRKAVIDPTTSPQPKIVLSFEDICPHWSLALATGESTNSNLDIREGKNCIVGEAHGFRNSAYICSKCWEYSQSFVSSVYGNSRSGYIITDHEYFESTKNDFVQHFNQKHAYRESKVEKVRDHAAGIIRSFRSKLDQLTTDQINI
jgi:hypothetical protein